MGTLSFILVLCILVFFHELGHFIVARLLGVKVYVFSIGFGKKLLSKNYKGTLWTISLIPLGGYVKMKGQDDLNPSSISSDKDSYNSKTPFQRILILFAGPAINFVLAFFLYITIAILGNNHISPTIGKVLIDSPAQIAGLKKNDIIVQINSTKIYTWKSLSNHIRYSNKNLKFYIKRDGKLMVFMLNPQVSNAKNIFKENIKKRMIGISPAPKIITIKYNLIDSIAFAFDETIQSSKMMFLGVQKLIQGVIPSSEIGGVIAIGSVVSKATQSGIVALLTIMALISVNLGVLNLLPIPALDGGHIMFNLYEMITKRKPNQDILMKLTIAGWVILGSLMILGFYNDINRLIG